MAAVGRKLGAHLDRASDGCVRRATTPWRGSLATGGRTAPGSRERGRAPVAALPKDKGRPAAETSAADTWGWGGAALVAWLLLAQRAEFTGCEEALAYLADFAARHGVGPGLAVVPPPLRRTWTRWRLRQPKWTTRWPCACWS